MRLHPPWRWAPIGASVVFGERASSSLAPLTRVSQTLEVMENREAGGGMGRFPEGFTEEVTLDWTGRDEEGMV